ncbi:MICOS complex subunit MIC10-like [Rhododendron vialii]|uniref:MICOS complex subunit MIC10-like n=1 Tax=Rhododendron vialii TaxID=182163 RepID=UPI00265E815E|nr:MICOS complex subunit MIC10-like [Rhododendron vialii]
MAEKNSPALPQDTNAEWDARIGLAFRRFVYPSVAGACGSFFFKSPAGRWASLAFGAGVGVGSAYAECYGSSAKFANPKSSDIPASPNGED